MLVNVPVPVPVTLIFSLKYTINPIFLIIFAPDIVHISNESTGQKPSCRGGNSLNYTLLGNLNPVHLLR